MQHNTALADAMAKALAEAGDPPAEQARGLAVDAMTAHADDDAAAVDYFNKALKKTANVFAQRAINRIYYNAVRALLREEARREETLRREAERGSGAGHGKSEDQQNGARPASPTTTVREHGRRLPGFGQPASQQGGGGQTRGENQESPAPAATPKPRLPPRNLEAMDVREKMAQRTFFDWFKVNEQPIGLLTPRELLKAASARDRDGKAYRRIVEGLALDEPIGKTGDPIKAERIWNEEVARDKKARVRVDAMKENAVVAAL